MSAVAGLAARRPAGPARRRPRARRRDRRPLRSISAAWRSGSMRGKTGFGSVERAARPAPLRRASVPSSCSRPSWRRISLAALGHRGRDHQRRPAQRLEQPSEHALQRVAVFRLLRERPGLLLVDVAGCLRARSTRSAPAPRRVRTLPRRSRCRLLDGIDLRLVRVAPRRPCRRRTCAPSRSCGSAGCRGRCRGRTRSAGTAPRR